MVVKQPNFQCSKQRNKSISLGKDPLTFTKTKSKSIIVLTVKFKTIKLLEYRIGENRDDFAYGDVVLAATPKS